VLFLCLLPSSPSVISFCRLLLSSPSVVSFRRLLPNPYYLTPQLGRPTCLLLFALHYRSQWHPNPLPLPARLLIILSLDSDGRLACYPFPCIIDRNGAAARRPSTPVTSIRVRALSLSFLILFQPLPLLCALLSPNPLF
jgi:hypothetical protein